MKGKFIKSIGSVLLLLAIMTGVVYAFSLGSTDGTWGQIDYLVESPCTTATDLFISEYVYNERGQGQTDQVAIEIYNGTGSTVSRGDYSVRLYRTSGTTNPVSVPLTAGFLNDQDVWVLVSANFTNEVPQYDQTFTNNENYTTIVLLKGTDVIDVIGSLSNPTTTNPSGKEDMTFRRKFGVCKGDTDGDTAYAEWNITDGATYSDLGQYITGDNLPGEDSATCAAYGRATNSAYSIHDVVGVIYNRNVGPGGESERWARNSSVCAGDVDGDILFYNNASFGGWTYTSGEPDYTGFGTYVNNCTEDLPGLIVSEYAYEARSGFNNPNRIAIEIYNGTGAAVNLGTFKLLLFTNDRDFTEVQLTGTLADGAVYVVANIAASGQVSANQTFGNNNDYRTVVLIENYIQQVIDEMTTVAGDYLVIQNDSVTDENQVRYGRPSGYSNCPTTPDGFAVQSGFGFEGIEVNQSGLAEGEPFPVGRFCHYNSPINADNAMEQVPFNLTINNIACDAGWHIDGVDGLSFTYITNLDETSNSNGSNPCEYGPGAPGWPGGSAYPYVTNDIGPNRNGCGDMVSFTASASTHEFTCVNTANPTHTVDYTVSILGFTPTQAGGVCPSEPVGEVSFNRIYTAETAKNCFCVYAAYTRGQITPVTLYNFSAQNAEGGILVSWETMTETNNLGFNIMRAEGVDGEQTQVNPELIMSEVAPGDAFGAYYEYLDETVETGKTYYYWLIDVPLNSIDLPGVYGPVMVERQ